MVPAKRAVDRPVQVAADHALDLGVARDHLVELLAALRGRPCPCGRSGSERRVVHHRRPSACPLRRKRSIQPREALFIQAAAALAGITVSIATMRSGQSSIAYWMNGSRRRR